eukprot:gene1173-10687_t
MKLLIILVMNVLDTAFNGDIWLKWFQLATFIVYSILTLLVFGDIVFRIIAKRLKFFYHKGICWLNLMDIVIVTVDILVNISALGVYIASLYGSRSSYRYFGAVMVFRLTYYIGHHPQIRKIVFGLRNSCFTIFTVFLYLFVVLYTYGIVGIIAFNDEVSTVTNGTTTGCTSAICQDYFQNIYQAMFTMFQVMSGDSWLSGITREGETQLPYFSFLFFGSFYVFTTMILLNLLTGIILDAIQGGENDLDQLKKAKKEMDQEIEGGGQTDDDIEIEFEEKSEIEQVTEKVTKINDLLTNMEDNFNLFIAAKLLVEREEEEEKKGEEMIERKETQPKEEDVQIIKPTDSEEENKETIIEEVPIVEEQQSLKDENEAINLVEKDEELKDINIDE